MEDDEGKTDWAAREAARERRKEQEAKEAREKEARDKLLKDERGLDLFKELRAWMDKQAKSYSGQIPTQAFDVGRVVQVGGLDPHHRFEVSSPRGERLPMKIFYRTPPESHHGITVDCGVVPMPRYFVAVRDNDVFFETLKGQAKAIEDLGSELLDTWRSARM